MSRAVSGSTPDLPPPPRPPAGGAIHFLSDYGLADEFVGVVHAVLAARTPGVPVVDLTHAVAPFDVTAGARVLERAAPHLGPGAVLAVVDPGVGTDRPGVALEVATTAGPRHWVGPDNGLLPAAAEAVGSLVGVTLLDRPDRPGTFDGRDVFAPAVAALVTGQGPERLGRPGDPADLVRLPRPLAEAGTDDDGRFVRLEVTWVDRFGNVQLAASDELTALVRSGNPLRAAGGRPLRSVRAFAELGPDELGLLIDANGHPALVAARASAAERLGLTTGSVVVLRPADPAGG